MNAPAHRGSLTLLCVLALLLSACGEPPARAVLGGGTMGTTWSVVYGDPQRVDPGALQTKIEAELLAINEALSTYLPDSEITRINEAAGDAPVTLSQTFATVLDAALRIGELSGGAYDVTVGPLVDLWGFGAGDFSGALPSAAEIDARRALVGAGRLDWDPEQRRLLSPPGMRIDLSSIAKGFAVDRLVELLSGEGLENTLVEIGGELRASGRRPEGGPWRVAVESPDPGQARILEALAVSDVAVATSGDYRNYFTLDGRRYSHLVDPRSGYPVEHDLVSVTVLHERCMEADALATALIVMGLDAALELAEAENIVAYFVSRSEGGLEVHYTPGFEAYRYRDTQGSGV